MRHNTVPSSLSSLTEKEVEVRHVQVKQNSRPVPSYSLKVPECIMFHSSNFVSTFVYRVTRHSVRPSPIRQLRQLAHEANSMTQSPAPATETGPKTETEMKKVGRECSNHVAYKNGNKITLLGVVFEERRLLLSYRRCVDVSNVDCVCGSY